MKNFSYKAKDGPDKIVSGVLAASDTQEVVDILAQQGLVATSVKESSRRGADALSRLRPYFGVGLKEVIIFSQQLAKLISSGVPLLRSLNILSQQTSNPHFKNALDEITADVKSGQTLSMAISHFPSIFSSFYTAMIRAGEGSGSLDKALLRISVYHTKQYELLSKIRTALAYPILILLVGTGTLFFIFTNVIPRLIPILTSLHVELPWTTKLLIGMSAFLRAYWAWGLIAVLIFGSIFKRSLANATFRLYVSRAKLRIPFFGSLVFKSEFGRFARALETALRSGIPIITSIDLTLPIVKEDALRTRLAENLQVLASGGSLGSALRAHDLFPLFVSNLIMIGEESGRLAESLNDIALVFEEDCDQAVKVFTALLEPLMVLVIGLIVGFIVSAVLMPIFQLNFMQV